MIIDLNGPGIAGTYHPFRIINHNDWKIYNTGGGPLGPVTAMSVEGPFGGLASMYWGPANGGSVITIVNTANNDGKPFNLYSLPGTRGANATQVSYNPATLQIGFPGGITAGSLGTRDNCAGTNCNQAASGSFALPAGKASITILDRAVTASSQIQITPDASLGDRLNVPCNANPASAFTAYGISARIPGQSFTLTVAAPANAPNCYSFTLIN